MPGGVNLTSQVCAPRRMVCSQKFPKPAIKRTVDYKLQQKQNFAFLWPGGSVSPAEPCNPSWVYLPSAQKVNYIRGGG